MVMLGVLYHGVGQIPFALLVVFYFVCFLAYSVMEILFCCYKKLFFFVIESYIHTS